MGQKFAYSLALTALTFGSTSVLGAEVPPSETGNATAAVFESRMQTTTGPLDLRIGDLAYVLTPEQLEQALGTDRSLELSGVEAPSEQQLEQIEVRATREQHGGNVRSAIPFGFASIVWAFNNPTEAWRLFMPVQLDDRSVT